MKKWEVQQKEQQIETIKATTTNQIENTELKNTMTVLKNSIEDFNSWLNQAEKKITELKVRSLEMIQSEEQKGKKNEGGRRIHTIVIKIFLLYLVSESYTIIINLMKKTFKKLNVIPYIEAWLMLGITEVAWVVSKNIMPTIGSS